MAKKTFYQEELEILREDFKDLKGYLEELEAVLPIAICTLNSFWIVMDVNKAVTNLTKYKQLEIIGQPINLIFSGKEALNKARKEAEKGKVVASAEMTLITRDRKKIPVSISLAFAIKHTPPTAIT